MPLAPLLFAACMDEYVPLLAGAAAATPLTRVSRACRNVAEVSAPFAEVVAAELDELDPPPQPASPATATGASSSPDAIRQQLPAILHPLTLWKTHMTMRDDRAPGVTGGHVK